MPRRRIVLLDFGLADHKIVAIGAASIFERGSARHGQVEQSTRVGDFSQSGDLTAQNARSDH